MWNHNYNIKAGVFIFNRRYVYLLYHHHHHCLLKICMALISAPCLFHFNRPTFQCDLGPSILQEWHLLSAHPEQQTH